MVYNISIIRKLTEIRGCGVSEHGLGLAYLYSLFRRGRQRHSKSKDPLVDEARDVYQGLEKISGYTLALNENVYLKNVEKLYNEDIRSGNVEVRDGTVEKLIVEHLQNGHKDLYDISHVLGKLLKKLSSQKPNYGKPLEEIGTGRIQRIEQRNIFRDLEASLK